jgi:endonuclease/exonuclease/phosphatase family metal-dependent hydrolase
MVGFFAAIVTWFLNNDKWLMWTVGTFNLCLVPRVAWWRIAEDRRRVDAFFEGFEGWPDVLLLQEVWDSWISDWGSYVERRLREKGYGCVCRDVRGWCSLANSGLVIAVRGKLAGAGAGGGGVVAVESVDVLRFRASTGIQWFVGRGVLSASVVHPEIGRLRIFNTHLHATTEDTSWLNSPSRSRSVQQRQIDEMAEFVARTAKDNVSRVVVGGDFNVDSFSAGEEQQAEEQQAEGQQAEPLVMSFSPSSSSASRGSVTFRELQRSMRPLKWIPCAISTYPHPFDGNSPLVEPRFANRWHCLDHIFSNVDGMITEVWAPVSRSKSSSSSPPPPRFVSDHAAVIARME